MLSGGSTRSTMPREVGTQGRRSARFAALLSVVAFALHYAWEIAQCSPYFIHASASPTTLDMVRATLGDVVMTWIAFAVVAAVAGRSDWPFAAWGRRHWLALEGVALLMSVAVERYALATGRWSYMANNPRIQWLDVSVLPVAQMVLLLPATFALSVWLVRRLEGLRRRPTLGDRRQS
jgi:hypothetical protein